MKRIASIVGAGLLSIATSTTAFSADLPRPSYKAPIYSVHGYSWTGFYAGINGGYGFGTSNWSGVGNSGSTKPKGALAGITLGYNLQTGSWVWGLEGDANYSWVKGSDSAGTGVCTGAGCETRNTWLGTARGRIGYAGWDRWLPYITGGAAFGSIKMTPNTGVSESKTRFGWTVGGGLEYAILTGWTTKIEYLYADLGTANCSVAACGTSTDVSFKEHIVRLGLNYRF